MILGIGSIRYHNWKGTDVETNCGRTCVQRIVTSFRCDRDVGPSDAPFLASGPLSGGSERGLTVAGGGAGDGASATTARFRGPTSVVSDGEAYFISPTPGTAAFG